MSNRTEGRKRSEVRSRSQAFYEAQATSVAKFLDASRVAMDPELFSTWHDEALQHAGESLHVFDYMISALRITHTPITPPLRKAIEAVLTAYAIERGEFQELSALNYDDYWARQYGYR